MTDGARSDAWGARPRVRFKTLGCKVNRVESEAAARALLGHGWDVVEAGSSDVIVVNTCTVTAEADTKARKEIRRALGSRGRPVVVVTGCLAALSADELSSMSPRVVVEADRDAVAARVAATAGRPFESTVRTVGADRTSAGFRTRAVVKVQDGCGQRCSYCIVPDARGLPVSRPLAEVVTEVGALTTAGTGEIVLTGVNIGMWRAEGADLADLLDAVCAVTAGRVRVSSIEPTRLTGRFLEVVARRTAEGTLCPHFHVPLQSGSDRVLAAMNRPYDTAAFSEGIGSLRHAVPDVAVTTDVIAGFPGETVADADSTLRFIKQTGFQRLHVFRFSERPGTPATAMTRRVPVGERSARAEELRALSAGLLARYTAGRVGARARVLIEQHNTGTAEDYLRVYVGGEPLRAGTLVDVVLGQPQLGVVMSGRPLEPGSPKATRRREATEGERR